MNLIAKLARQFSERARHKRALIFKRSFHLDENTKILDLGSAEGEHIHSVLQGTSTKPENVYIADINSQQIQKGAAAFGYVPVLIKEKEEIQFDDQFFDIVYCSSVIEHVTVPKSSVWSLRSGSKFRKRAQTSQREFSDEIRRLGKQYFVQTPNKYFPIESHSWLPFVAWLPRRILIPLLKITNLFWVKKTSPDWYLLDRRDMAKLFQGAKIVLEKSFGLTKSIMAISSDQLNEENPEATNNLD